MTELDFIKDKELRDTIENSIEYIYALFEQTSKGEQKQLYIDETYRVIILYVISAIEAILMYFYKVRKEKIERIEYKFVSPLPKGYKHEDKSSLPVVIAVQEKIEKKEYEIGLSDLIMLFKAKKLIQEKTAEDILDLNNIRNTFHLSKPRTKDCDLKKVELALNILVHTIKRAPHALKIDEF